MLDESIGKRRGRWEEGLGMNEKIDWERKRRTEGKGERIGME